MPDLGSLIRARIEDQRRELLGSNPLTFEEVGVNRLVAALLAVLDLHKPRGTAVDAKVVYDCAHCRDTGWGGPDVPWPCETVEAIAEALGIEVA